MKKAIGMISDKKSDDEGKLWSNHVIHAPYSFTVHLSLMATTMMLHGYNSFGRNSDITVKEYSCRHM